MGTSTAAVLKEAASELEYGGGTEIASQLGELLKKGFDLQNPTDRAVVEKAALEIRRGAEAMEDEGLSDISSRLENILNPVGDIDRRALLKGAAATAAAGVAAKAGLINLAPQATEAVTAPLTKMPTILKHDGITYTRNFGGEVFDRGRKTLNQSDFGGDKAAMQAAADAHIKDLEDQGINVHEPHTYTDAGENHIHLEWEPTKTAGQPPTPAGHASLEQTAAFERANQKYSAELSTHLHDNDVKFPNVKFSDGQIEHIHDDEISNKFKASNPRPDWAKPDTWKNAPTHDDLKEAHTRLDIAHTEALNRENEKLAGEFATKNPGVGNFLTLKDELVTRLKSSKNGPYRDALESLSDWMANSEQIGSWADHEIIHEWLNDVHGEPPATTKLNDLFKFIKKNAGDIG